MGRHEIATELAELASRHSGTTAYDKTQAIGPLDELKTAGIMMHATPDEPAVRGDLAVAIER